MRILIAEDGRLTRKVLADALTELGHEWVAVADGDAAWETLQAQPFDVLITDWEMPGLTGVALCERVRSAARDSYLYVIILTAHSARAERFEALAAGVDDFLTKPLDVAELAARLAVAERILRWSSQLQAVNDLVMKTSQQLAEKATQIDLLRQEAEYLANHDVLTGMLNRRAWLAAMEDLTRITAVAMVDVDYFKRVNDTYGHPAGDAVLREVAARLASGPGVAARFGGEEFSIGFTCPAVEARAWCDHILREVAGLVTETDVGPVSVTVSIGLVPAEDDLDRAVWAADNALYEAKKGGRNQVVERRAGAPAAAGRAVKIMPGQSPVARAS
ncbi:MAG: diguanylate cyclase [Dehalococcoidia bacterium]